jgi:formylglycine-generating enzyme required for sulfatase activity
MGIEKTIKTERGKYFFRLENVCSSIDGRFLRHSVRYEKGWSSPSLKVGEVKFLLKALFGLKADNTIFLNDGLWTVGDEVIALRTGMSRCIDVKRLENVGSKKTPFLREKESLHVSCAEKVRPGVCFNPELLEYIKEEEVVVDWREYKYPPINKIKREKSESSFSPVLKNKMKKMILVEGGTFSMGNTRGDIEGYNDETPTHEVELTYNYWIGKYPVTFAKYDAYTKAKGKSKAEDQGWGRGKRPVINVSWWEAIAYCNWLSKKEGFPIAYDDSGNLLDKKGKMTKNIKKVKGYRLPTEAEWEYAARGGQKATEDWKYAGSDNLEEVGWYGNNSGDEPHEVRWYDSNSGSKTHEVGQKTPNELGIFDMSGNVWEWCYNWYVKYTSSTQTDPTGLDSEINRVFQGSNFYSRVFRGGSWYSNMQGCRVARRNYYRPCTREHGLGFRVVKTCSKKEQAC